MRHYKNFSPNKFFVNPDGKTITIFLSNGEETTISKQDYKIIKDYRWRIEIFKSGYRRVIAVKMIKGKNKKFKMHRIILGVTDPRVIIDHINRNPLDNTRGNLRICTASQNMANKVTESNKTGFKGVKIISIIKVNNKRINLGTFSTIKDAAIAYNNAAIKYFGEFAVLNKI